MQLEQFYLESLGHASYLLGSETSGEAIVVDPRRDVEGYVVAARRKGLRITRALDTHGHNDYVTGLVELRARTPDLEILASANGEFGYDHRPVKDGETIELGEIALEILHTPGHTPEHLSVLVREGGNDEPALLLSGGALLVGDVARPDLLGGAAETREAARALCRTLQERILTLPDHVAVFPTHVAGSLCGANIGSRLSTTVGYERRTNPLLARVASSDVFVRECLNLEDLPAVPPYWKRMRGRNLAGPEPLGVLAEPAALPVDAFADALEAGAVVVDARSPEAFGGAHIPGSLNVTLGASFATWAGTVVPEGAAILLVLDGPDQLWDATWQLLRIGYDAPVGWLADGLHAWRTAHRPLDRMPMITADELRAGLERGELEVLDVRQPAEWSGGHIEGATFIPGGELPDRLDEAPSGRVAVVCGSGHRASVMASFLEREADREVVNVLGGMSAWRAARLPTVED